MSKEDIQKAKAENAERIANIAYSGGGHIGQDDLETAFENGVKWRINSVWHDVEKELPEYNRHVVNEDWFDFTAKDEKDLKRIMNQYPFKRWAYVDDLKPNMEE